MHSVLNSLTMLKRSLKPFLLYIGLLHITDEFSLAFISEISVRLLKKGKAPRSWELPLGAKFDDEMRS